MEGPLQTVNDVALTPVLYPDGTLPGSEVMGCFKELYSM